MTAGSKVPVTTSALAKLSAKGTKLDSQMSLIETGRRRARKNATLALKFSSPDSAQRVLISSSRWHLLLSLCQQHSLMRALESRWRVLILDIRSGSARSTTSKPNTLMRSLKSTKSGDFSRQFSCIITGYISFGTFFRSL